MPSDNEPKGWTNTKRSDGLHVIMGVEGWVIMPAAEGLPVDKCPCCDKPFQSKRAAQICAGFLYPMAAS